MPIQAHETRKRPMAMTHVSSFDHGSCGFICKGLELPKAGVVPLIGLKTSWTEGAVIFMFDLRQSQGLQEMRTRVKVSMSL